ncbi:type III secretion system translocon subunit SctE [Comamonas sp. NLF-1-9]|uniref:type III secretion system translocon subunit SctE n=1 Tax=Comamonas sp. NLF-1-9 TaxID=2853163 RepID=UPI001C49775F|nr:type III secretion system translocon subunit SctE [Comamonas sp. NLF-1-9]QXL83621.1 type III secretion system translocon subunit SctE [Comamonas sp. NLF-1-9]
MNGISINPGLPPQLPAAQDAAGPAQAQATQGAAIISQATLQELEKTLGAQNQKGDGVKNAHGAPNIANPLTNLSADDLIALLQEMQSKSQDQQVKSAKLGLEKAAVDAKQNTEAQAKKIQEWAKKVEKEAKAGLLGKIFSWIGKIFAVIAAAVAVVASVVATPFSGGAAAALTALAVVGLVAATMSLADQISKEAGGPEISLSNMMTKMVGGLLQAFGVPQEKAEQIGRAMAGALAILAPAAILVEPQLLGTMVQGIAQLAGADEKTTMALTMAFGMAAALTVGIATAVAGFNVGQMANAVTNTTIKMANSLITAGSQIIGGATQVAQGATTIAQGAYAEQGQKALADKKELEAFMLKLNQAMEDQREELRKVMQEIEDGVLAVSRMVQASADSMSQITSNIGKRAAV